MSVSNLLCSLTILLFSGIFWLFRACLNFILFCFLSLFYAASRHAVVVHLQKLGIKFISNFSFT